MPCQSCDDMKHPRKARKCSAPRDGRDVRIFAVMHQTSLPTPNHVAALDRHCNDNQNITEVYLGYDITTSGRVYHQMMHGIMPGSLI
jgi:hypothetical protein